jgi:hypothetical protein
LNRGRLRREYAMPEYYLYTIKKDGHSAEPPKVVECQDDEAAVKKAKQLLDDRLIEIWEGARVVMRLDPNQG